MTDIYCLQYKYISAYKYLWFLPQYLANQFYPSILICTCYCTRYNPIHQTIFIVSRDINDIKHVL